MKPPPDPSAVLPTEADIRDFIRKNPRKYGYRSDDIRHLFPEPKPGKSNIGKILDVLDRIENVQDPGREARHRGYAEDWKKNDRARLEKINKEDRARQRIKSLPKSAQEQIRNSLSKGLGSGNASTGEVVWSNLRKLLSATGKKALPFGTALAIWELAGRPDIPGMGTVRKALSGVDPTARSRERDRSSEAGGYVEERLQQLVSPAPW